MSKVNKYQGTRELEISVSDFVLRNKATGVETYIDTVESENLSKTSDQTKVKAGINNDVITTINSGEEISLEIVDVVARQELVNAKWNAQEKTGAIVKTEFPKNYTVGSSKTITLPQTPLDPSEIIIYNGNTALNKGTDFDIEEKTVTIKNEAAKAGDSLFVTSYSYQAEDGAYYEVGEGATALVFEILQKKPIFDDNLNIIKWKYRHYGKATMDTNAEESGQTERQSQPITYKFSIEKASDLPYVFRTWYEDAE